MGTLLRLFSIIFLILNLMENSENSQKDALFIQDNTLTPQPLNAMLDIVFIMESEHGEKQSLL